MYKLRLILHCICAHAWRQEGDIIVIVNIIEFTSRKNYSYPFAISQFAMFCYISIIIQSLNLAYLFVIICYYMYANNKITVHDLMLK